MLIKILTVFAYRVGVIELQRDDEKLITSSQKTFPELLFLLYFTKMHEKQSSLSMAITFLVEIVNLR